MPLWLQTIFVVMEMGRMISIEFLPSFFHVIIVTNHLCSHGIGKRNKNLMLIMGLVHGYKTLIGEQLNHSEE